MAEENVTVIDAVNGVREAQTVVVEGGRIAAVMDANVVVDALETVDGTGRYLIPGLWDFHVHVVYDERFTEAMPGLFLNHGITSIRDTGGPLEQVLPVVEAMRAEGRTHTPLASLSRSFGAVRGQTLIICVPGSPRGALESLDAVDMILGHALDTLGGRTAHT